MPESLLLVASFGTTHDDACEKTIGAVERRLAERFAGWEVRRAFTSEMVRAALAKRGGAVDNVPEALARAKDEGFTRVVVLPTHLLYGEEHEKLARQARAGADAFATLNVAPPLLASTDDMLETVRILSLAFPPRDGHGHVLMGHGSRRGANAVYAALAYMFAERGRDDVVVATVEAYPGPAQMERAAARRGWTSATLAPFMLVAGEHAVNDLAGDRPDSWKSLLARRGMQLEVVLRGLGEYEAVRELYVEHARQAIAGEGR